MVTMWAKQTRSGFTIVELLIVIVIIAILAAITIVAYNGIQDRARSSAAASSSSQAAKKIKVWQVDNGVTSPTCAQFYTLVTNTTTSTNCSFDFKDTNYQYTAYAGGAFCVTTTVVNKSYKVSEATVPQAGGCNGHGQGGVPAITNLVTNPSLETNTASWTGASGTGGASSVTTPSTGGYSENKFFRMTFSTAPTSSDEYFYSNGVTYNLCAENTQYTFSGYIRPSWSGANYYINIVWYDSSSSITGSVSGTPVSVSPGSWTPLNFTATSPATTYRARIQVKITGALPQVNDTLDADAFMMTQGSSRYNYADGDTTNWVWNGTANGSSSTGPPV